MEEQRPLHSLSDDELLQQLTELLRQSRRIEAELVAHIGEVDERRLYAREASPSMFAYCTDVLHLSEAEAYLRIAAARAAREHPVLLVMLADGRLHLTGLVRLASHLTRQNRDVVLARAVHKSKRQIDELVAELSPRPDVPAVIRKLPERRQIAASAAMDPAGLSPSVGPWAAPAVEPLPSSELLPIAEPPVAGPPVAQMHDFALRSTLPRLRPDGVGAPPARPATVGPLAPGRYRVQFTASAELRAKLERLRALMRTAVPDGDLATIIEDAVTEKLRRLEARRFACTAMPRGRQLSGTAVTTGEQSKPAPWTRQIAAVSTRHIPAAVRRAVYVRDGGRCRYTDAQGRRCTAREGLEFHHRHPYGYGGGHGVGNVQLMCHAHNAYLAEVDYGTGHGRRPAAKPLRAGASNAANAVSAPRPPAATR